MNRWHAISRLFWTRALEFYREPEAVFWVYGFPVLLAVGLGVAFWSKKPEPPAVDVERGSVEAAALAEMLKQHGIEAEVHDAAECRSRLRQGKTALYVAAETPTYQYAYDESRPESLSARYHVDALVQRWKAGGRAWPTVDRLEQEPGNRYIDFLLPGLMGMNLMGGGLWGVGFVLVDMRVRKLLKRFLATPMRRGDFLVSLLCARLLFMLPEMVLLLLVGYFGFGVPIRGSFITLTLVILIGASSFSGIGLLVACRAEKIETVSGLMNLVMLPMWLLSGTFFSSKRFPDVMQPFIQALPLTQLNEALREVLLEGAGLGQLWMRLGILIAWMVVSFTLALRWFRWQ